MDSIVEENGNSRSVDEGGHNLTTTTTATAAGNPTETQTSTIVQQQQQQQHNNTTNSNAVLPPPPLQQQPQHQQQQHQHQQHQSQAAAPLLTAASVLSSTPNVQYHIPASAHGLQMQSVIQAANQSSVIQTAATHAQSLAMSKGGGVVFMAKPNPATVIQTTSSNAVQLPPNFPCKIKPEPNSQSLDTNSDDSLSDDDSPRGRRDLTRRPSYHKILTEISGPDISGGTTLHLPEGSGLPTIANTGGGGTAGTLIHLPQDSHSAPAFYLPNRIPFNANNTVIAEDQTRKREIRLQKNREAARECRRKKKEYIKCLENRVAVLENQNKALIEELKSLKELYCQTKND